MTFSTRTTRAALTRISPTATACRAAPGSCRPPRAPLPGRPRFSRAFVHIACVCWACGRFAGWGGRGSARGHCAAGGACAVDHPARIACRPVASALHLSEKSPDTPVVLACTYSCPHQRGEHSQSTCRQRPSKPGIKPAGPGGRTSLASPSAARGRDTYVPQDPSPLAPGPWAPGTHGLGPGAR